MGGLRSLPRLRLDPRIAPGSPVAVRVSVPVRFSASSNRFLEIDDVDEKPESIERVQPVYPPELRRAGKHGGVTLRFVVDTFGRPIHIRASSASSPEFIEPAVRALSEWRYKPGKRDGEAVPVQLNQMIAFTLSP